MLMALSYSEFDHVLNTIYFMSIREVEAINEDAGDQFARDKRFSPYFKGCVGVANVFHLSEEDLKNGQSQRGSSNLNALRLLAIVDQYFRFVYLKVYPTANNADIYALRAMSSEGYRLRREQFVLANSRFGSCANALIPYPEITKTNLGCHKYRINNKEELFNFRHAQLSSISDRAFDVFQKRFPILQSKQSFQFPLHVESRLIYVLSAVHNFIISHKLTFRTIW